MRAVAAALLLFAVRPACAAGGVWTLDGGTLRYQVTHPMHEVEGVSGAVKGKGQVLADHLEFLLAVPVRSFDSGDSNRDSHMLEVTRAALHPMVVVRVKAPLSAAAASGTVAVEATVEFAGATVTYPSLTLSITGEGETGVRVTGTLPLSLKAYGIAPPSLLAIPVRDAVPLELDLRWRRPAP